MTFSEIALKLRQSLVTVLLCSNHRTGIRVLLVDSNDLSKPRATVQAPVTMLCTPRAMLHCSALHRTPRASASQEKTFQSLPSSEPAAFVFRFSFFSFFFRFLSALSSGVSPSWRLRFLLCPFSGASALSVAPAVAAGSELTSLSVIGSSLVSLVGDSALVGAMPFSRGALKSLYSAFHLAGVASFGRPYFYQLLVNNSSYQLI